jgi:DinB superfamily
MSGSTELTAVTALIELANQVRQFTLQCLAAADPSLLTWAPPGTSNHMLWHAGHVLWVQDLLTVESLTGRSELPSGWAAKFGSDPRPATITDWPRVAEVSQLLESQLLGIQKLLTANSDEILKQATRTSELTGWQLFPGMIHGWHDEARHHGEMYLILKMLRAAK